ncbi:TetR/AcrR family transcriptional regulator [Blastococcus sp. SYSU DS0510]
MPARDLRADLVAAATTLLEREGSIAAVSLRGVAREAGVSAPAVYGHFADLDELLRAVLDEGFEQLRSAVLEAVERESDPVRRLLAGCRTYVLAGLAAPARYRAMFGPRKPDSAEMAFAVLVQGIEACVGAGRSRSLDPREEATLVWTALHGVVTLRSAAPAPGWPDLDGQLSALVERLALLIPPVS